MDNFKKAFVVEDSEEQVDYTEDGYGVIGEEVAGDARWIERGGQDIARTVRPDQVIFHEDYYKLNETYCRVIYLEGWPTEVHPNWLREIYQFHRAVDVSVFYQPLPVKSLLNKLRQKSARESAELQKDEMEGNSIDFARRQRLEDALELQNMLQRGETKPFQVSLLIQIRAESLKELNDLTVQIEKIIDSMSARTRRAHLRQKDGMLSMMPLGRNFLADGFTTRNMHTQGAEYTFPFANADLTHPSGIWYGINRSTNSNVILDRFQLKSAHAVVLGQSGSGKSYGAKLEMLRALMHGMPVMVVDPDGECERLCHAVGGQFITIGPNSPDRINVLDFSSIADGREDQLTPKIWSVAKLIGSMMNPDGTGFGMSAQQFEILEYLLRHMYADFGYTQDPRTQAPVSEGGHASAERMPVLSDVRARLEAFVRENEQQPHLQAMVQEIISAMGPYCAGGALAGLFDQKTTVDLRAQFVVFNIRPLTQGRNEQLMSLGMHTVLEYIWNSTMNRKQALSGVRRFLFVDEAHVMMRSPESASFLEDLMKRARKYNVGVTILTQDPKDFVRPDRPQGQAILSNSSMQIVLNMKRNSLELLQELLGLDDTEVNLLSTQPSGVGMIFAENDRAWISMHTASPQEHELITTNPDEVAAIEARANAALTQGYYDPHGQLPGGASADPYAQAGPGQFQLPEPSPLPQERRQPRAATIGTPSPVSQVGPAPAPSRGPQQPQRGPMPLPSPQAPVAGRPLPMDADGVDRQRFRPPGGPAPDQPGGDEPGFRRRGA